MISYDFNMILTLFYKEPMTSYDILGPPKTAQDLPGPHRNYYDFIMILALFYKDTMTSYDLLRLPKTSQDLPGPHRNYYDFP